MLNYYNTLDQDTYVEAFYKNKLIEVKNNIIKSKIKILTLENLVGSTQYFYN